MADEPTDLDNLFDFLDDDALRVPVKSTSYPEGKVYVIPSPDAETGLRLSALSDLMVKAENGGQLTERDKARLSMSDDDEREFQQQVLGPVFAEMVADGVSHVRIQRVTQYGFLYFAFSPEAAETAARNGILSGKGVPAAQGNRATRRAAQHSTTQQTPAPGSGGSRARRRRR